MVVPKRECREVILRFCSREERISVSRALRNASVVLDVTLVVPLVLEAAGRIELGGMDRKRR